MKFVFFYWVMVIVLGDVMVDKYTYGKVERISPEAPVPVLLVEKEEYRLGGAANVANNLASLGEQIYLIGVVGKDLYGKKLKELCEKRAINCYLFEEERPTTVKHRFIAKDYNQQLMRVDSEDKKLIEKETENKIIETIEKLNKREKILVVSDYAKGVMTKGLMEGIKENFDGLILVDPKPKNIDLYKDVYLIKPNLKEVSEILGYDIKNNDEEIEEIGKKLVDLYNCNFVITRSEKGATLITKGYKIKHFPSEAKEVYDVSGAGDTFIAVLAYGLNKGLNLGKSVRLANKASSIVVGKVGTATVDLKELYKK